MKESTKAYMAGLLDAEGCISIAHVGNQFQAQIIIVTIHRLAMKWVADTFGGVVKTVRYTNPDWNTSYRWVISNSQHAKRFLSTVLPYMVVKKAQAYKLLEYLDCNSTSERIRLCSEIAELKKRSVTTDTPSLPWKNTLVNAYLAGFFDGEGHIGISVAKQHNQNGVKYMPAISVANTYIPIVDVYKNVYGGFVLDRAGTALTKPSRQWFLTGQPRREKFLLSVLPYLQIKREQAKLLLEFVRMRGIRNPEQRRMIMTRIRSFNGRKIQSELTGDSKSAPVMTQAA